MSEGIYGLHSVNMYSMAHSIVTFRTFSEFFFYISFVVIVNSLKIYKNSENVTIEHTEIVSFKLRHAKLSVNVKTYQKFYALLWLLWCCIKV